MIPADQEARLIQGLKGQSAERDAAMAELYSATRTQLFGLALRMTGGPDLADDAIQETFVDVMRGIHGFQGKSRFTTWLFRIAMRASLRVASRHPSHRAALPEDLETQVPSPRDHAEQQEAAARLLAAITSLPPAQRAVVALNALEGVPLTAVAEILGIAEGTVHSRLHTARARLRQALS